MAFVLGFFLESTIGMIGFWFLEVNSLLFVYMLLNFFLSGHMFPIDMLDGVKLVGGVSLGDIVRLLPLQYLAYFPSAVFLGKVAGAELVRGLWSNSPGSSSSSRFPTGSSAAVCGGIRPLEDEPVAGFLPPGIHPVKRDEIDARFGHASEIRSVQRQLRLSKSQRNAMPFFMAAPGS